MLDKALIFSFLAAAGVSHAALVDINFDAGTELAAYFRDPQPLVPHSGHTTQANGYVTADHSVVVTGSHYHDTLIYDTTPANAVQQNLFTGEVTISLDARTAQAGSIGLWIINPSESGNQQLALFNWDVSGGTTDRIRLSKETTLVQPGIGATLLDVTGDAGAAAGGTAFTTITLRYWEGLPGTAYMNFTAGTFSTGDVSLGAGSYFPSYQIGIRAYDDVTGTGPGQAGGTDFDNFTVVPEPGMAALCLISGLAAARRRR